MPGDLDLLPSCDRCAPFSYAEGEASPSVYSSSSLRQLCSRLEVFFKPPTPISVRAEKSPILAWHMGGITQQCSPCHSSNFSNLHRDHLVHSIEAGVLGFVEAASIVASLLDESPSGDVGRAGFPALRSWGETTGEATITALRSAVRSESLAAMFLLRSTLPTSTTAITGKADTFLWGDSRSVSRRHKTKK
jgi:hypothetical protein